MPDHAPSAKDETDAAHGDLSTSQRCKQFTAPARQANTPTADATAI
jgi:hypothetical protein